jgi:hypothetical protein
MHTTNRKLFLVATALIEAPLGLCLIFLPALPFALLLGLEPAAVETLFVGRVAGAALLAIGVASWMARADPLAPAQFGLLTGLLIYDAIAAILLVFAGSVLKMSGVLLWPAVALHAILAAWCLTCLRPDGFVRNSRGEGVDHATPKRN